MKKSWIFLPLFLVMALFLFSQATAKEKDGLKKITRQTQQTQQTANRTLVNVGQVAMWIYSDGASAITPGGCSGLIFPRGNNPSTAAIFADGFIWAGIVNDGAEPALRVGGGTYSIGTVPGAIISQGVAENFGDTENVDRIWRVRRDYATADLRQDAAEVNQGFASAISDAQIEDLRALYKEDWVDWPTYKGAPFYDADGDGEYNPGFRINSQGVEVPRLAPRGEEVFDPSIHADEPGVADADQVVWLVSNDLDPGAVSTLYGSPSIGFEQQITLWAYRRADALGQIVFKQFRLIYKGTATTPPSATIDSLHFCQWSDPDLGSFGDDFVGSDTTLSLGYAYNATSDDATYSQVGLPPPASGYDFFAGPLVPDPDGVAIFGLQPRPGFRNLPMTTFGFFAAGGQDSDPTRGGDYNGTLQWWNLVRGFRPRPESPATPWRDNNGNITKFVLAGDPVAGTGDIDSNPGDRRLLLASGPFTMALGDTNETVVAVMAALGSDRLSSVSVLKFVDRFAQEAFDNLFELPKAPPTPVSSATEFAGQILLNWAGDAIGVAATEQTVDKGFEFEGYNVRQLPTAGASAALGILLATFDVPNEVTVISQEIFDENSGLILTLPVQQGTNSGISRTFIIDTDRIRENALINGQTYYFGVSAYSFNPDPAATLKTLESPMAVLTVVPQTVKPGVRLTAAPGDVLEVTHGMGVSDGAVQPIVVDPTKTLAANYDVTFNADATWNLVNATSGDTVLANIANQSGDADYLITDGLQVVVSGPALEGISFSFEGARWTTGGGHGGELFFGGAFLGNNFTGSNLAPADFRNIHVDFFAKESFTDLNGNGAYDIGEPYQLPAGAGQLANRYSGFGSGNHIGSTQVPFRVFDTEVDPPRQLDIVVRDRDQNGQWDLHVLNDDPADPNFVDVNGGDIRFNYVYILDTDYDATGASWDPNQGGRDFFMEVDGDGGPVQWLLWMDQRGSAEPLGADFTMDFVAPNVNTVDDVFGFTSTAPSFSASTAEEDLRKLVNVFPNPYLGINAFEENRFQRFMTFSHLPEKATIRIFSLAGVLVRTIEKDDPAQFQRWDLQNEAGLPVASGIYIANLEFPDNNFSKTLKLVLIQEQQFLRNF